MNRFSCEVDFCFVASGVIVRTTHGTLLVGGKTRAIRG